MFPNFSLCFPSNCCIITAVKTAICTPEFILRRPVQPACTPPRKTWAKAFRIKVVGLGGNLASWHGTVSELANLSVETSNAGFFVLQPWSDSSKMPRSKVSPSFAPRVSPFRNGVQSQMTFQLLHLTDMCQILRAIRPIDMSLRAIDHATQLSAKQTCSVSWSKALAVGPPTAPLTSKALSGNLCLQSRNM